MARELITTWEGYQSAVDRLLSMACHDISIYDADLKLLKLDSPNHLAEIKRVLLGGEKNSLQIIIRQADELQQHQPKLIKLLADYGHSASAWLTPPELAHLRDSMILVDGKHALIRFEQNFSRSKLLIEEAEELRPYLMRFSEIRLASSELVGNTTLGL